MKNFLLLGSLFLIPFASKAGRATSSAAGDIANAANYTYSPSSPSTPQSKDTLIIQHAMQWTSTLNWSATTIKVLIIKSGGAIGPGVLPGPGGNGFVFTLPTGAKIIIEQGGQINNPSGNNSNHSIEINGATVVAVWGKKSCSGNGTVLGPVQLDAAGGCTPLVLPLHLVKLESPKSENLVSIKWVTTEESEISYYEVQRSTDGFTFSTIATVASKSEVSSNKTYEYNDLGASVYRKVFYRIQSISTLGIREMVGITEPFAFSNVIVQPIDNKLKVTVSGTDEDFTVQLYDLSGKKLLTAITNNSGYVLLNGLHKGTIYIARAIVHGVPEPGKIFCY